MQLCDRATIIHRLPRGPMANPEGRSSHSRPFGYSSKVKGDQQLMRLAVRVAQAEPSGGLSLLSGRPPPNEPIGGWTRFLVPVKRPGQPACLAWFGELSSIDQQTLHPSIPGIRPCKSGVNSSFRPRRITFFLSSTRQEAKIGGRRRLSARTNDQGGIQIGCQAA